MAAAAGISDRAKRDPFLDAVRAVAVVRVVTWHTFGWAPITWVVAAVPAMFFVTGHLLARSFARRPPRVVVADRLRRMLVPFWCFGLLAWGAMAAARGLEGTPETALPWRSVVWWVLPLNDPHGSVWEGGWLSQPLWYLRCLLWLLLLAPVLHAAARRALPALVGVLVGATVALDLTFRHVTWHDARLADLVWRAGDLTLYATFLVLGFAHARGLAPGRRWALAGAGAAVPLAYLVARVAQPPGGVVNDSHVLHLVVGGGWLALALAARGPITAFAGRRAPGAVIDAIGRRSLSIYLWHTTAVITTWHLLVRLAPLPRGVHSLLLGVGTVVGTVAIVSLVGGVEDLAARRPARRRAPARVLATRAVACGLLITVAAALLPATAHDDRPLLAAPVGTGAATSAKSAGSPTATKSSGSRVVGGTSAPAAPRVPSRAPSVRVVEDAPVAPAAAGPGDAPAADPDAADPAADGDLGAVLSRWQDRYSSSSLIVGVTRPGVWEWTGNPYGGSGEGTFDIESITKTVTASAVWLLAADGVITIDAPVPPLEALPELGGRGITVRQLLEHTSGIPDYHTLETPEDVGENPAVTVARNALSAEPEFAPGVGRDYSSTNYLILGLLIEERTGRPLDDVLWSRVLEPAGVGELFGRAGASVYLPGGGAGGLVTDAHGLLAWGRALLRDHRPVGEGIWANLTRLDPTTALGAGLMGMCPCSPGFTWIGHTGGTTALFYDRASDVLVAVRIANGIWGGFEDPFTELMADLRTAARAA